MEPYERLLGDAARGDATLFSREDAVEESWRIVDPILGHGHPGPRVRARHLGTARGRTTLIAGIGHWDDPSPIRGLIEGGAMKPTQQLHELGQSLWLDNITRKLLTSGTLRRYLDELSITGLTSNPTIFDHAIKGGTDYDDDDPARYGDGQVGRGAVLRARARRT